MDSKGNGIITKQELKDTLHKFMITMVDPEFKKLWEKLVIYTHSFYYNYYIKSLISIFIYCV